MTLVQELEKADLEARAYKRGPAGPAPFVIAIQNGKPKTPGLFRTWEGNAEIDVHRNRRQHQAVINTEEPARAVTRDVTFNQFQVSKPRSQPSDHIKQIARARFPVQMGGRLRWTYGDVTAISGGGERWAVTVPVHCHASAQIQSLLVGLDEVHYFVSALPEVATAVKEAHELLRPPTARKKGTVRQGNSSSFRLRRRNFPML